MLVLVGCASTPAVIEEQGQWHPARAALPTVLAAGNTQGYVELGVIIVLAEHGRERALREAANRGADAVVLEEDNDVIHKRGRRKGAWTGNWIDYRDRDVDVEVLRVTLFRRP